METCRNCNNVLRERSKFCDRCGMKIANNISPSSFPQQYPQQPHQYAVPPNHSMQQNYNAVVQPLRKQTMHFSATILALAGWVFAIFPPITYICCRISMEKCKENKEGYDTTLAMIFNYLAIIAGVFALLGWVVVGTGYFHEF